MKFKVVYKLDGEKVERYFFALTFTRLCSYLDCAIGNMRIWKIERLKSFPKGVDYIDLMGVGR